MKCANGCTEPAEIRFLWPTSAGPQEADLCGHCAARWWSSYAHTPAGQGLIIEEVGA